MNEVCWEGGQRVDIAERSSSEIRLNNKTKLQKNSKQYKKLKQAPWDGGEGLERRRRRRGEGGKKGEKEGEGRLRNEARKRKQKEEEEVETNEEEQRRREEEGL